jgi:putative ubiquitin-RnfH superfamily antitoxin RatB of RatAB toxin-antitoxin module
VAPPSVTRRADKRCLVAFAAAQRQFLWPLVMPAQATIGEAIAAARLQSGEPAVPWDSAPVGVFGELRSRAAVFADGDRIELYRPLSEDPRQRRRAQSPPRRKAGK